MKLVLFLFVLLSAQLSLGQDDIWLEGRGKAGFLVAHRSIMGHVATEHAFAGELSLMKQGLGSKSWHEAYKNPYYGITAFFGTVGNRELLGHYIGCYGFISIPLIKFRNYSFSGKLGSGLGYGTKVYDPESNPLSIPVSTHFNAMVSMAVESRLIFNRHELVLALDMTHFSNGAAKVPNLGLNLPYVSLGYGYKMKGGSSDSLILHPEFEKYWEFGGIGILSVKEVFPTGQKKYPVYAASLSARRYFKRSVGAELCFDFISKQAIFGYQPDVPKTQGEIVQLGLFAGYLLPMNHLHAVIGMGVYIKDKFQPEDAMYHRVGLRYVFDNGLNINLVLKSHWARADYVEYGIGYTFRK